MAGNTDQITLLLKGSRTTDGVSLLDFEAFIENFVGALRDFARDRAGVPVGKTGRPEASAAAAIAFRLTAFRKGSAIATIEPIEASSEGDTVELIKAEPIQMVNLRALLDGVERGEALPASVAEKLRRAVTAGGDDGSLSIDAPSLTSKAFSGPVVIDRAKVDRIQAAVEAPRLASTSMISGRLHRVDFEPGKLAIRASDGVDWICEFPGHLEARIESLVNRLVWATGSGALKSPQRGTMELDDIQLIEQGIQGGLFSGAPISGQELAAEQGVLEPQSLDTLSAPEWTEADEEFLAAIDEV